MLYPNMVKSDFRIFFKTDIILRPWRYDTQDPKFYHALQYHHNSYTPCPSFLAFSFCCLSIRQHGNVWYFPCPFSVWSSVFWKIVVSLMISKIEACSLAEYKLNQWRLNQQNIVMAEYLFQQTRDKSGFHNQNPDDLLLCSPEIDVVTFSTADGDYKTIHSKIKNE